jgi:hypothetical protein
MRAEIASLGDPHVAQLGRHLHLLRSADDGVGENLAWPVPPRVVISTPEQAGSSRPVEQGGDEAASEEPRKLRGR